MSRPTIPALAIHSLLVPLAVVPSAGVARAQSPEDRGALTPSVWDAGDLSLDGTAIHVHVYYPESGGPYPLVGVIHGANADGSYHVELATTLASRGFVAVVPDMPCEPWACDHAANQRQISALLAWAVAQSGDASSRLSGKVDGERRGLIGHSWGGLSSHLTAARDPSIDAVVLLDPNDDGVIGLSATSEITVPHLTLRASRVSVCDSAWQPARVRDALSDPHMDVVISRSGHCDPAEVDGYCTLGCGVGDSSTTPLFRRYAIAWTECVLTGDPAMASWLGGPDFDADVAADRLSMTNPSGLELLPCRAGMPSTDAGVGSDAGTSEADAAASEADALASDLDGGSRDDDAGLAAMDAGARDAGAIAAHDAGRAPPAGGCTCRAGTSSRHGTAWALAGLAVLLARRARRRSLRESIRGVSGQCDAGAGRGSGRSKIRMALRK
ncbi:MAG: hypothetical protein U0353_02285 [Sandaracinus sp.]